MTFRHKRAHVHGALPGRVAYGAVGNILQHVALAAAGKIVAEVESAPGLFAELVHVASDVALSSGVFSWPGGYEGAVDPQVLDDAR